MMTRNGRLIPGVFLILTSALTAALFGLAISSTPLTGASSDGEPPPDLVKKVALREQECEEIRSHFMYRQSVVIEELPDRGEPGRFREVTDIIFSPQGERTEQPAKPPVSSLHRLILTPEDFNDIRHIQPMLITPETLPRYRVRFRGDETVDSVDCWVLEVTPKQLFAGFRMFDGLVWVDKESLSVVRTHGQAVPAILNTRQENLFPRFTTVRRKVDGGYWFPVKTFADDILPFKNGPLRMKMMIEYTDYKKFGAESSITFEKE